MRNWLAHVRDFFTLDLSEREFKAKRRSSKLLLRELRIVLYVGRRAALGKNNERAAALTYLSLLSIIPLVAVVFSLFKAFGGFADLQKRAQAMLLDYIPDSSEQVAEWLAKFIDGFNAGAVGVIGMGALLVTVILTLSAVEDALNETWAVRHPRSYGSRLLVYWSLITVGPLLLGGSIALTATFQSRAALAWLDALHIPMFGLLQSVLPLLSTALAFTALYSILPSARVGLGAACTGGIVGGGLFELCKWGYTVYTSRSVSSNALYGSLAAFPVFVIWLNYSWRIVLFGADVVQATQYANTDPTEETDPRTNQATREEAAVRIAAEIAYAFANRQSPPTARDLSMQLMLPANLTEVLCQHLLMHGLLRETKHGGGLLPAQPLEALSMADVVRVLRHHIGVAHWSTEGDAGDAIDELLLGCERAADERMRVVSWAELARHRSEQPAGGVLTQDATKNNLTDQDSRVTDFSKVARAPREGPR